MESAILTSGDPLIAALPPATDYLTYLTLLEYQLRPDNLSTLNGLLTNDNGKLAAEIGWDLLKLVLPMLQIVPEEANKCLSIIARRGNPREVVVRVAEELERLGQSEDDNEATDEEGFDQEELPTFAGEAPRIHLGELKLDDKPDSTEPSSKPTSLAVGTSYQRRVSVGAESGSDDILILQALLSMLSILHPRIKTQYPSRFLATSLPAALGAYRRMAVTEGTTSAFIEFLSKMSGKQRPALPPRVSTAASIPTTNTIETTATAPVQSAPLPDPEAQKDLSSQGANSQVNEKAITERLLQAVMLEVLDEYTNSFQITDQPSMSWTIRLREKHEPKRVLPQRPTETQRWSQSPELRYRDASIAKFLKLGKDLNLDNGNEINHIINPATSDHPGTVEQPETDYPTSPSQIPFPTSGLILLFAAQNFAQDVTGLTGTGSPPLTISAIRKLFSATFALAEDLPHPPSLSQTDALLSLIYTTIQSPISQPTAPPATTTSTTEEPQVPSSTSQIDLSFLTNLTNLFTTSPDPSIRDSTHHLTTLFLHKHTNPAIKLLYIKSLLSPNQAPASPIHDIQQGNLHAVAINWLKDEFLSYNTTPPSTTTKHQEPHNLNPPTQPPIAAASSSPDYQGLDPHLMQTDPELASLVYPILPPAPGPFITSQPGASATNAPMSTEMDLETLLLQIPGYIAALNLTCILASFTTPNPTSSSTSTSDPTHPATTESESLLTGPLLEHVSNFINSTTAWKDLLLNLAAGIAKNQRAGDDSEAPVSVADIYALEDAVGRAKGAIANL